MPRGHAPLFHRLEHHLGPATHLVERRDIERADLPDAVAFEAVRLEERNDVTVEGRHGRFRGGRAAVERDQATDRPGPRDGDGPAREDIVDRRDELATGRLRPREPGGELIVDPAGIGDRPQGVEHDDTAGPRGA